VFEIWVFMAYRFLDHRADVKFRADGESLEEMFIFCLDALNDVVRGDIDILERSERGFEVEGVDYESLLYNFLEEFLVMLDRDDFLTKRVKEIKIDNEEKKLRCVVVGDRAENYKFTNDVKAVTYSEMFVREDNGRFECQVVLDV
jgi:SHS2 domain-containing protein